MIDTDKLDELEALLAKAQHLSSIQKSKVNAPDPHHHGMRLIAFKVDLDDFGDGNAPFHYPIDCLSAMDKVVGALPDLIATIRAQAEEIERLKTATTKAANIILGDGHD